MSELYYFLNIEQQSIDIRRTEELLDENFEQLISDEQHDLLYQALNNQCVILPDLTFSEPKPSAFHIWDGSEWVDNRTEAEKNEIYLAQFLPLTRRQFKLALLENDLLETIEQAIANVPEQTLKMRIQIEYSESERFERSNESVQYMLSILNLTEQQVDEMWLYALTL